DAVAAGGRQLVDVAGAGGEGAVGDVDFLAIEVGDDAGRQVDHLVDPTPDAARRQDARVTGDAGITRVDAARARAGVPLVDRVVVLHARVGAPPGGERNLFPQIAGLNRLGDLAIGAIGELPVAVLFDGLEEAVGDAYRVVAVLAA